jgi:hypothetical protein
MIIFVAIMLLLTVLSPLLFILPSAQATKSSGSNDKHYHTTTSSSSSTTKTKITTALSLLLLPLSTSRNVLQAELNHLEATSPKFDFRAISQQLKAAAILDRAVRDPRICNARLNDFILQAKESRFIVLNPCVSVSGTVTSSKYFNADGDASFNIILDLPYNQNMIGPGNRGPAFALKYRSEPALHIEVICQGAVTSTKPIDVGACNGYNGPNFKPVLPHRGDHVQVMGRYLIEPPELPGGITEIHPVRVKDADT